jgi:hypothetical protein
MSNDQFNPHVFTSGAMAGIGGLAFSMMAGMQNAMHEVGEIIQEHHNQANLQEFFDGVRATYDKQQKMIDEQAVMIDALTAMCQALEGQLAIARGRRRN